MTQKELQMLAELEYKMDIGEQPFVVWVEIVCLSVHRTYKNSDSTRGKQLVTSYMKPF